MKQHPYTEDKKSNFPKDVAIEMSAFSTKSLAEFDIVLFGGQAGNLSDVELHQHGV